MRVIKMICIGVAALTFVAHAKNTYSVFSIGPAIPISGSAALVDTAMGNTKNLGTGWEAGWTFFGLPFSKSGPALSGLAFGGKISYCRWVRDSTLSELTFLGTQGIVRYYLPVSIKPFDLFVQAGSGMTIGEHGFADPDTLNRLSLPQYLVNKGIKKVGSSFNIGIDWDVFEVSPGVMFVPTRGKASAWFSIDAAMKF